MREPKAGIYPCLQATPQGGWGGGRGSGMLTKGTNAKDSSQASFLGCEKGPHNGGEGGLGVGYKKHINPWTVKEKCLLKQPLIVRMRASVK